MKTSDLLRMCVQNLWRRKFRTLLTIVGVIIGTAAIISMISLGIGINKNTDELISQRGNLNMIDVYSGGTDVKLNDESLETIAAIDGVDAITPFSSFSTNVDIVSGKNDRYNIEYASVEGVYPLALDALGYKFTEGHAEQSDGRGKRIPVVFGADVAYNFSDTKAKNPYDSYISQYPDEYGVVHDPFVDPMNDIFTLKVPYFEDDTSFDSPKYLIYELEVTGVLAREELEYSDIGYTIFMDTKDVAKISEDYDKVSKEQRRWYTPEKGTYSRARVMVGDLKLVSEVQNKIDGMQFYTQSTEQERQEAMASSQQMQIILGGLGAVSLLVAAISIANTMVMSVYERTREIGIMKVLGCFVHDIRSIFLVEAALIGFLGGLIGVGLSYLISYILNTYGASIGEAMGMMTNWSGETASALSVIPLWLVALGMAFATIIGVSAGFYPASRAVKISALEAIKQD